MGEAVRKGAALAVGLALLLGVVSTGCGPNVDTIRGQVFIVTKSHESVKLGLVTIALFPEATVRKHVAMAQAKAVPEREALELQVSAAEKSISEAKEQVQAALRGTEAAWDRSERIAGEVIAAGDFSKEATKRSDAATNEYYRQRSLITKWQKEVVSRTAAYVALQSQYMSWDSGRYFLDGLPSPLARAQTDANGEFTIQVAHKGRFVLAARAERQTLGSTEEYTWLVLIPEEARDGAKVLLSNETLTTEGSPLSVVHTSK